MKKLNDKNYYIYDPDKDAIKTIVIFYLSLFIIFAIAILIKELWLS